MPIFEIVRTNGRIATLEQCFVNLFGWRTNGSISAVDTDYVNIELMRCTEIAELSLYWQRIVRDWKSGLLCFGRVGIILGGPDGVVA